MSLKERINFKIYIAATIFNLLVNTFISADNFDQKVYLNLILFGSLINQLALVYTVNLLFGDQKPSNLKILLIMIVKTLLLGAVFYIATQKIPDKLHVAMIIYIFQLIILSISIKRNKI